MPRARAPHKTGVGAGGRGGGDSRVFIDDRLARPQHFIPLAARASSFYIHHTEERGIKRKNVYILLHEFLINKIFFY